MKKTIRKMVLVILSILAMISLTACSESGDSYPTITYNEEFITVSSFYGDVELQITLEHEGKNIVMKKEVSLKEGETRIITLQDIYDGEAKVVSVSCKNITDGATRDNENVAGIVCTVVFCGIVIVCIIVDIDSKKRIR